MGLGDLRVPFRAEVRVEHFGVQSLLDHPDSLGGKTRALAMVHSRARRIPMPLSLPPPHHWQPPAAPAPPLSFSGPASLCLRAFAQLSHGHGVGQKTVTCALTALSPVVSFAYLSCWVVAGCLPSLSACVSACARSRLTLGAPWTAARQAPLPVDFSRRECGTGLLVPIPASLPSSPHKRIHVSPAVPDG